MESFKQWMRRARLRAGYKSQGDAAKAIGCERGTVSMWEAPSSPTESVSSEYLLPVARAYRVKPDWVNEGGKDDGYPWTGRIVEASGTGKGTRAQAEALGLATVSQSVRFNEEILSDALQVIRGAAQWEGSENAEISAREIAIAYALIEDARVRVSNTNLVGLVKAYLNKLQRETSDESSR